MGNKFQHRVNFLNSGFIFSHSRLIFIRYTDEFSLIKNTDLLNTSCRGLSNQCFEGVCPKYYNIWHQRCYILALRVLHDIIDRFCIQLLLVQRALQLQTHLDDIFTGAETIKEAYKLLWSLIDHVKIWVCTKKMVQQNFCTTKKDTKGRSQVRFIVAWRFDGQDVRFKLETKWRFVEFWF